jgi:hypothetical protein
MRNWRRKSRALEEEGVEVGKISGEGKGKRRVSWGMVRRGQGKGRKAVEEVSGQGSGEGKGSWRSIGGGGQERF